MQAYNYHFPIKLSTFFVLAILGAWLMAATTVNTSLTLAAVPVLVLAVILLMRKIEWILFSAVIMAFFTSLLSRYIVGVPFGLSIDGLLLLMIIAIIFNQKISWNSSLLTNVLNLALLGWIVFSLVSLANPSATNIMAWLYANRGLSFYPFLFVFLTMYSMQEKRHLKTFLTIWAGLSILGTLWGIKQLLIGVSTVEQQWLNAGAASTHILFGRLRAFSFFSDCAQFAANQSHTALVFGIISLYPGRFRQRWIFMVVAGLTLYGMVITGTRGVLAVLAVGGLVYLLMTKNFKIVLLGLFLASGTYIFLRHTYIGQSNYQIQRLRSALDANDPSFQVRQERIKILRSYLADKPLGGGIGSAGYWGKRFNPGSFLAEIGTDGHYTRIWMETGIIGLYFYLIMLSLITIYLGLRLWPLPNSFHKQIMIAFFSGWVGLCAASYTNGLMIQHPTGALLFTSLGFVFLSTSKIYQPRAF
ncbi:MAG: O-antigen ligase domain-containing protein [Cyclobacteriaceae bacterium]|nr:O-antigen ligase domain-containing protein [Cyclobacteriaceae bacterium HetDA_MAG_MS6]